MISNKIWVVNDGLYIILFNWIYMNSQEPV